MRLKLAVVRKLSIFSLKSAIYNSQLRVHISKLCEKSENCMFISCNFEKVRIVRCKLLKNLKKQILNYKFVSQNYNHSTVLSK